MPQVDDLNIKIKAEATKAVTSLDNLISKLGTLSASMDRISGTNVSSFASSIGYLAKSINQFNASGVKTQDFTRIASNLSKLNSISSANLPALSTSIRDLSGAFSGLSNTATASENVVTLVNAVSRFGYTSMERAITNIPRLASSLTGMFTTLSTAPNVSGNIVRMTEALARLSDSGARVRVSTDGARRSLSSFNATASLTRRSTLSLAAAFGKFYANYFLVLRGIKLISKAVTGSMDYVETYNYFSVTMKKIGNQFGKDYEQFTKGFDNLGNKLGYSSAEEYAKSFSTRLNDLTKKMTGFEVGASGQLISTSELSLGLDPERVMNFQASIASITNSVGMLGESSVNTSKALTMLSADLSSLKNIDLSTVMQNLQSGIIGQSRALYKYGIDITQATLAQYALSYGIKKSVAEMSQSDKMQLRLLAILDQSRIAWGDQANTLNSVANQYRIFRQQIENLGRVIGNLFLPIAQKVLPVINGLIIALRRLFETIGFRLYGDNWLQGIMDGVSEGPGEISEELADDLDQANENAKKLKRQLQGFDELNVLSSADNGGLGGSLGGIDLTSEISQSLADYERVWQEAFDRTRNLAENYAARISNVLQPIKNWIDDFVTDAKIGNFFALGRDVSNAIIGAFDTLSDELDTVDWDDIGEKVGKFLKGINWKGILSSAGNFFEKLFDAAVDLWVGSFETAPVETAVATAIGLLTFTEAGQKLREKLMGIPLEGVGATLGTTLMTSIITAILGFELGKKLGEIFIDEDLYGNFSFFGENGFFEGVFGGYNSLEEWLDIQNQALGLWALDATNILFGWTEDTRKEFSDVIEKIFEIFDQKGLLSIYEKFIKPIILSNDIFEFIDKLKTSFGYAFVYLRNAIISFFNNSLASVETFINTNLEGLKPLIEALNLVGDITGTFSIPTSVKLPRIPHFAEGGYPEMGELFYANENGVPELVGQMNGKTAVASGNEITGITSAIYDTTETQNALLNTCISLLNVIADKEFGITDGQIANSVIRSNREYRNRTGRPLI